MRKLKTDHDDYDLAHGPDDLVRRQVIRLPIPEAQKITPEEREQAVRLLNVRRFNEEEQRRLDRKERIAKLNKSEATRNQYLMAAYARFDEHVNKLDPHPRYSKAHARRPLKQTLERMQAQYDSWVTNTDPHPRWRSERIVNLTFFGAMNTMREEQAAMGDLLGLSTPEEG